MTELNQILIKGNSVEKELSPRIDFDFSIFYQSSDGFVVCDDNGNNSPLINCLEIIRLKN